MIKSFIRRLIGQADGAATPKFGKRLSVPASAHSETAKATRVSTRRRSAETSALPTAMPLMKVASMRE